MQPPCNPRTPQSHAARAAALQFWLMMIFGFGSFLVLVAVLGYARYFSHLTEPLGGFYDPLYGDAMAFLRPAWAITGLGWAFYGWKASPPKALWWEKSVAAAGSGVLLGFFTCLMVSAALCSLNGALDGSRPYEVRFFVLGKRKSRGKHPQHFLQLRDARGTLRIAEIRFGSRDYRAARVGDSVAVRLRRGALGAEWIEAARLLASS